MKNINIIVLCLVLTCFYATNGQAQEAEMPEIKTTRIHYTHAQRTKYPKEPFLQAVPVTHFDAPFNEIKLLDNDDREQVFVITDKTTFHNENNEKKKAVAISKEYIKEDTLVTIVYTVSNNRMVALDITIPKKITDDSKKIADDNVKLKGVLEAYQDGIAIIGGSKVKLLPNTVITCISKPECECKCPGLKKEQKGKSAYVLDSTLVSIAPFVKVKGDVHEDGILYAEEMEIKENLETNLDKRYLAKMKEVVSTKNMVLSPNNEYARFAFKGNVTVAETSYNLLEDSTVQKYVNAIGKKITPQWYNKIAKERGITPSFYVLNNDIPDAFSYGDGKVFITTGLLKLTKNEHQLAFILAHEIAHITHKHSIDFYSQSIFVDKMIKVVDIGAKVFTISEQIKQVKKGNIGQVIRMNSKGGTPTVDSPTSRIDSTALPIDSTASHIDSTASPIDSTGQMPPTNSTMPSTGKDNQAAQIVTAVVEVIHALKPIYFNSILPANKEMQADRVGLLYLKQAGYDLTEIPKLWDNVMLNNKEEKFFDNLLTATYKTVSSSQSLNNTLTKNEVTAPDAILFAKDLITNLFTQTAYVSVYKAKKRLNQANKMLKLDYQGYQPLSKVTNEDAFSYLQIVLEK